MAPHASWLARDSASHDALVLCVTRGSSDHAVAGSRTGRMAKPAATTTPANRRRWVGTPVAFAAGDPSHAGPVGTVRNKAARTARSAATPSRTSTSRSRLARRQWLELVISHAPAAAVAASVIGTATGRAPRSAHRPAAYPHSPAARTGRAAR